MAQKVAIVGLGYVGLPLAQAATHKGHSVIGFDVNSDVISGLSSGVSHIGDITDDELLDMFAHEFRVTNDPRELGEAEIFIITVPTPLSVSGGPDLGAVRAAAMTVREHLKLGDLVVLESTSYPGTTEDVVGSILEGSGLLVGIDFSLAFSPERIDPGNQTYHFSNTCKVVGGVTASCGIRAEEFYKGLCTEVVLAKGAREAELAKLIENTYRHVNIALMNELLQLTNLLGIDLWDSIRCASTKPFGFQPFFPGPGVGGHCIPIDPNYLSHMVRSESGRQFRLVELAQEINQSMPTYVTSRIQELLNRSRITVNGARVLLMGVTYKQDITDTRESPAMDIAQILLAAGAQLQYWDPNVPSWSVSGLDVSRCTDLMDTESSCFDIIVVLQHHKTLPVNFLESSETLVLDTRGKLTNCVHL